MYTIVELTMHTQITDASADFRDYARDSYLQSEPQLYNHSARS